MLKKVKYVVMTSRVDLKRLHASVWPPAIVDVINSVGLVFVGRFRTGVRLVCFFVVKRDYATRVAHVTGYDLHKFCLAVAAT
jgi:hypothetical protein